MSNLNKLELKILGISYRNKLSHIGSCLTTVGIIDSIYSKIKHAGFIDKFVLSCGHCHLAHAVVMEDYGIIKSAEENIQEHGIHCERAGGCDCSTGSLGLGITVALGMAMADRTKKIYCLISDGEATEGAVYEALHIKEKYSVRNLIVYCNYNGYGAYDETRIEPLRILPGVQIVDTSDHWFIKKYQQEAHYKALGETEYLDILIFFLISNESD